MRAKLRPVLLLYIIFTLLTLTMLPPGSAAAVGQLRLLFTGTSQASAGGIQLQMAVTPPVVRPGASLNLHLIITNQNRETAVPEVTLELPAGLSLDRSALPAGTTLNLQTNSLAWQPFLPADGGQRELHLNLQADVADVSRPERSLTATLRHGPLSDTTSATVWVGMAPQATIAMSPARVSVGQPLQLVANFNGPGPFSQLWHLGDGRVVAADNPTVVYALPGTYQVMLQAANPLAAVTVGKLITVGAEPSAYFQPRQTSVGVNQPLTFSNQSGGQPPLRYYWDFGDGATANEPLPTHYYGQPGSYVIRLTVANDYGQAESVWPITVGLPPLADMLINESVPAGEPIYGQAFGDDSVVSFTWNMGDGTILEGLQISHVYRGGGSYWVTMTAANPYDQTQVSRWVTVEGGETLLYLPIIHRDEDEAGGSAAEPAEFAELPDDPVVAEQEPITLQPLNLSRSASPVEQLYHYLNHARQMFALNSLTHVYELTVAAQRHTEDMAANHFTGHTGSNGFTPPMRLLYYGYPYGYGGEVTAWGIERARKAVEFWLNSPPHNQIVLNPAISDVGLGYTVDYSSPNVWYWTVEFGSPSLPLVEVTLPAPPAPPPPPIRLVDPAANSTVTSGLVYLLFAWEWPDTLAEGQQFVVYLVDGQQRQELGVATQPLSGQQYQLRLLSSMLATRSGHYSWLVQLENSADGEAIVASEARAIEVVVPGMPALPTPEAAPIP